MLARYLVCFLLFAVLVFSVVGALEGVFTNFDFTGTAAVGIGFGILAFTATFVWDYRERRNSRK